MDVVPKRNSDANASEFLENLETMDTGSDYFYFLYCVFYLYPKVYNYILNYKLFISYVEKSAMQIYIISIIR